MENGIVTLSGQTDSFTKKLAAEKAVRKILGVKAIAHDIRLGVSPANGKTDTEIAEAVVNVLKWHTAVKAEEIKIKVEGGFVTLEGEVDWGYQRASAEHVVANLNGVRGINNYITIKPVVVLGHVENKIRSALERSASTDANRITAEVFEHNVIPKGKVRSLAEKERQRMPTGRFQV